MYVVAFNSTVNAAFGSSTEVLVQSETVESASSCNEDACGLSLYFFFEDFGSSPYVGTSVKYVLTLTVAGDLDSSNEYAEVFMNGNEIVQCYDSPFNSGSRCSTLQCIDEMDVTNFATPSNDENNVGSLKGTLLHVLVETSPAVTSEV